MGVGYLGMRNKYHGNEACDHLPVDRKNGIRCKYRVIRNRDHGNREHDHGRDAGYHGNSHKENGIGLKDHGM